MPLGSSQPPFPPPTPIPCRGAFIFFFFFFAAPPSLQDLLGVFPEGENRGRGARAGAEIWENPGPRAETPPESPWTPCLPPPLPRGAPHSPALFTLRKHSCDTRSICWWRHTARRKTGGPACPYWARWGRPGCRHQVLLVPPPNPPRKGGAFPAWACIGAGPKWACEQRRGGVGGSWGIGTSVTFSALHPAFHRHRFDAFPNTT